MFGQLFCLSDFFPPPYAWPRMFEQAFRNIDETDLRENKLALKKMRDEVLVQSELPAHLLEQLRQFQNQSRDDSFSITVEMIRALLRDADVGILGFEV
jgi:hypothetical protein